MKKTTLTLFLCTISILCSAQIQIESGGKKAKTSDYKIKEAFDISWVDDGYYLRAEDYSCAKCGLRGTEYSVFIFLGESVEDVIESKRIIVDWFKKARNKEYINVTNKNGQKVCLYKYGDFLYYSYGTEFDCDKVHNQLVLDAADFLTASRFVNSTYRSQQLERLKLRLEYGEHVLSGGVHFKKHLIPTFDAFIEDNKTQDIAVAETNESLVISEEIKELSRSDSNKYYIAWLIKSGQLNKKHHSELVSLFSMEEIQPILVEYSIEELEQMSRDHDKYFERFKKE